MTSVGSALPSSTGVGQLQICLAEVFELLFVSLRTPIPVEKREYHSFLCLVTLVMEVSMLLSGSDNGRIKQFQICPPHAASCLVMPHHGLTGSALDKSVFLLLIKYQNLYNSIELFNSFEGSEWLSPKQKYSECNSVHKHLANSFKKIIIKFSQKKAWPPLGEAWPRCERLWMQPIVIDSDFVAAPCCPQHLPVLALLPGEWGRILNNC